MSNRQERRLERRQTPRVVAPRVMSSVERSARSRRNRVLGSLFTVLFAALFVLGSFDIIPPAVGNTPSATLTALLAERGIVVERLDAAALTTLKDPTIKSPAELLTAAQGEVGGLTPASTDIVLVTATDPAPAAGSDPVRFNRALAYAYRFSAPDGGYLNFGGVRFKTAVLLIDPFTGGPMIGAGYEPAPSASPTSAPVSSPTPTPSP